MPPCIFLFGIEFDHIFAVWQALAKSVKIKSSPGSGFPERILEISSESGGVPILCPNRHAAEAPPRNPYPRRNSARFSFTFRKSWNINSVGPCLPCGILSSCPGISRRCAATHDMIHHVPAEFPHLQVAQAAWKLAVRRDARRISRVDSENADAHRNTTFALNSMVSCVCPSITRTPVTCCGLWGQTPSCAQHCAGVR